MPATLAQLRTALARPLRERGRVATVISSGVTGVDQCLPRGGLLQGSLIEWVAEPGVGAVEIAGCGVRAGITERRVWCVVDLAGTFQGGRSPTAPGRCCIVRPEREVDMWWTVEQALRCPGIGVTWCWAERVPEHVLRRWQIAAEAGGGIGVLFRPAEALRQKSWGDVRLHVTPVRRAVPQSRTVRVEVAQCRGSFGGQSVIVEIHHAPSAVCLASELVDPEVAAGRTEVAAAPARRIC